ncbi:MFS transporter [Algimonas porphyrae]|uniref:MFS transporter n=1 Tax=Algimonas porphyrae TaxID=1128113 RepID=A0ABQ5V001_9PROT|nr:MFS transporter [Algimonas porphyrae]GLQ20883.1 MFS transporter [Algimonas porphyrae]
MTGDTPQRDDQFAAFRHSSYSRYFTARFCSATAVQILATAIGWQLYDETGSALLLGLIGLVQFLPAVLLVIPAGLASDRMGRRLIMGSAIWLEMLCAMVILLLALTGNFDPVLVLTTLTVFGVCRAFYTPAASSLAVNLVPKKDFPNAVGWNTASWQLAHIAGPAAGGLIYGISAQTAYGTAVVLLFLSGFLIFSIPKPPQRIETEPTSLSVLLGGFSYVWREKVVLGAISLDLFAVLLGGAVALMPIYARDILELGPQGLGLLRAAPGIGAIAMLLVLTRFPVRDHAGKILLITVALFGLATAIFGMSRLAWLSITALIAVGAFDMVSVYIREIILQLWTPDEVRGRVNAVNGIFLGASNELGEFRAGLMAAVWGAVFTVTAGGIAAIGVAALVGKVFPGLAKIRKLDEAPDR